jgi:hypothetical protein
MFNALAAVSDRRYSPESHFFTASQGGAPVSQLLETLNALAEGWTCAIEDDCGDAKGNNAQSVGVPQGWVLNPRKNKQ